MNNFQFLYVLNLKYNSYILPNIISTIFLAINRYYFKSFYNVCGVQNSIFFFLYTYVRFIDCIEPVSEYIAFGDTKCL